MTNDPSSSDSAAHEEFVSVFAREQRRVFAYITTLLPNLADAEEVMQETSIVLWRKWGEFDRSRDFVRWANGVAHLEVKRFLRQRKAGRQTFPNDLLTRIADQYQRQADRQSMRHAALTSCLQNLAQQDLDLLQRRYGKSADVAQIAEALNRPIKSIYRSLARVRDQLFKCMQRTLSAGEREWH
jgi:RNA polymerase sigma-70 factor (ECF subfamily)